MTYLIFLGGMIVGCFLGISIISLLCMAEHRKVNEPGPHEWIDLKAQLEGKEAPIKAFMNGGGGKL